MHDLAVAQRLVALVVDGRERFCEFAWRVRPGVEVLWPSARTGDGLGDWLAWLDRQRLALG